MRPVHPLTSHAIAELTAFAYWKLKNENLSLEDRKLWETVMGVLAENQYLKNLYCPPHTDQHCLHNGSTFEYEGATHCKRCGEIL